MRHDLEAYRAASSAPAGRPAPLDPPRAHFLGPQQDSALAWRGIGGLVVCAVILALGSFLLI